ncbi:hypothetical protein ES703_116884 [subsurface metagenome]
MDQCPLFSPGGTARLSRISPFTINSTRDIGIVTLATCHVTSTVPPLADISMRLPIGCPSMANSSSGPYVTKVSARRTASIQVS